MKKNITMPGLMVGSFLSSLQTRFSILAISLWLAMAATSAHAQNRLSPDQMSAVMTVVNMFLLSEREAPIDRPDGSGFEIGVGQIISGPLQVNRQQQIFAEFELQNTEIEFCFDVTSGNNVPAGAIRVTINETVLRATPGNDNCYKVSPNQQRDINYIIISVTAPGVTINLSRLELASTNQRFGGLNRLTRGEWNERAVRKVLKIFAFGGHALDGQIQAWADMDAVDAIAEMLNFDKHNFKLSPLAQGETYRDTEQIAGNEEDDIGLFTNFSTHIGEATSNIPLPVGVREQYSLTGFNFDDGFGRMVTVRGLNPFRQKIGFWETNYHLAVNLDVGVTRAQVAKYYDVIMQAHEDGLRYYQVLGEAAKSAAVAFQYGHRFNEWDEDSGECLCNDDFGRELHQLFYGIFGVDDPDHEEITIPETAKMLTDMRVDYQTGGFPVVVDFQTDDHHIGDVFIFPNYEVPGAGRFAISGSDAAQKIDNLMPISMQHPESLRNLPVMIISVLADDNLSESDRNQLRSAWAAMGVNRTLLDFIHAYAVSDLFHSPSQRKFFTSHERALYMANKNNIDNLEAYFGGGNFNDGRAGRTVGGIIEDDAAGEFFRPLNNVFGGQTGAEASDSALIFENNYNELTDDEFFMRDNVECDDCELASNGTTSAWEKKWATVLPKRADGNFYVADVAEWLWNHTVGNFDNFTELERAHLYALLGTPRMDNPENSGYGAQAADFNLMMCILEDYDRNPDRYTNVGAGDPPPNATILDILASRRWDDYCRDDGGQFEAYEIQALNQAFTGSDIANDANIQATLDLLGEVTLPLEVGPPIDANPNNLSDQQMQLRTLRRNTLRRINTALAFIFTTPFVFAEGR